MIHFVPLEVVVVAIPVVDLIVVVITVVVVAVVVGAAVLVVAAKKTTINIFLDACQSIRLWWPQRDLRVASQMSYRREKTHIYVYEGN